MCFDGRNNGKEVGETLSEISRGCGRDGGWRGFALASVRRFCDSAFAAPIRGFAIPGRHRGASGPSRPGDRRGRQKTFELHPQFQPFQGNLVHFHTERWLRGAHSARLSADFRYGPDQSLLGEPSERLFVGPGSFLRCHRQSGPETTHMAGMKASPFPTTPEASVVFVLPGILPTGAKGRE